MRFGGLIAVDQVSLQVNPGEIVGIIGPNGAGKTTCFNMITGVHRPSAGSVHLDGTRIDGKEVHTINHLGIARTFQNVRLFKKLSVLDNVRIGLHHTVGYGLLATLLHTKSYLRTEKQLLGRAIEIITLFGLESHLMDEAGSLPYGDQRKLEIIRALATNPKLLLLDEPAAGMNPFETQTLTGLIRRIRDEFAIAILLIEHDMSLVMNLCERIYVLDYGKEIACGTPADIQNNRRVINAYLGEA
jgi:branched-chain amino acid transport system ATP-binding protein